MCCQHEGCHPDLFWLVSINLWETQQEERKRRIPCFMAVKPDHSVVWHNWCCFFLLSYITDRQSEARMRDLQQVWHSLFFSLSWRALNKLNQIYCTSEMTLLCCHYQLPTNPLPDKSSVEMRSHHFLCCFSSKVTAKVPVDFFCPCTWNPSSERQDKHGFVCSIKEHKNTTAQLQCPPQKS